MPSFRLRRILLTSIIIVITVILNYLAIYYGERPILALVITVIGLPAASVVLDLVLGKRPGIVIRIEQIFAVPNYLQILLEKVEASWLEQFLKPTLSRSTFFVPFTRFDEDDIRKKQLPIDGNGEPKISTSDEDQAQALQAAVTNSLHQMLILGEQGVGKTVMMLKILKWAVEICSEENKWNSVPVVLNLSTWNCYASDGIGVKAR